MATGVERLDKMATAGFSGNEILAYKDRQKQKMVGAGFSLAEASEYWGDPVIGPMSREEYRQAGADFTQTWLPDEGPQEATNVIDAWNAGFQISVPGLAVRGEMPDLAVPENASMFHKVVSGAATLAGDFPVMVAGGMAATAGGLPTGPFAPLHGAGVAFALPAILRHYYIQKIEKGEVEDFPEFWEFASGALIETAKAYGLGVATVGTGKVVGGLPAVQKLPAPLPTGASLSAEIATLTTVGAALEGEVPSAEDFVLNSILLGGLKAVSPSIRGVYRLKEQVNPTGKHLQQSLETTYARTGRRPAEVVEDAKSDPTIKEDLAAVNREIPRAYEELAEAEAARSTPKEAEAEPQPKREPTPEELARVDEVFEERAARSEDSKGRPLSGAEETQIRETLARELEALDAPAPTPRAAAEPQVSPQAEQRVSIESELSAAREEAARIAKTSAKELREEGVIGKDAEFATKKAAVEAAKEKVGTLQESLLEVAREPEAEPVDPSALALEVDAAVDHVLSKVVRGAREKPERPGFNAMYRLFVDRLDPIKLAVESAEGKLPTEKNAYELMRMLSASSAKAEHFITRGTFDFNSLAETGPSLRSIFERHPGELDLFRTYLVSARALELAERGIETGVDTAQARLVVKQYGAKYEQSRADLFEFQRSVLQYAKDAGVISKQTYELMLEGNKNYVPFNRLMDPRPEKAGATLGATTPLYRIKGSEREIHDPLESIILNTHMLIRASDRAWGVNQFFEMVERTGRTDLARKKKRKVKPITLDKSEAKKFAELFSEQLELTEEQASRLEMGFNEEVSIFRPAFSQIRETGEIVRMNKGKKEVWQLDPEIAEALASLDKTETNAFIKFMEGPAKLLRAGATLSPEFMARNPIRDTFVAYLQSDSGFRLFQDTIWGAFAVASTSKRVGPGVKVVAGKERAQRLEELYYEWMRSGGPMAELVALDRRYLASDIRKLDGSLKMSENVRNYIDPRNLVEVLRMGSQVMEQATRVGEYGRARKQGASIRQAGFRSRNVSVDFARAGSVAKEMNKVAAFFNAQIQGADLLLKTARENPKGLAAKGFASITLPTMGLYAWANSTEERRNHYREIPKWQRDFFWVFPLPEGAGTPEGLNRDFGMGLTAEFGNEVWMRIPKPFVYGYLFGTIPERSLDFIAQEDPDAFEGVLDTLLGQFVFDGIPTMASVPLEIKYNRSRFTDRPIIPRDRENILPEFQYQPYTTALSREIGRQLSNLPGGLSEMDLPGIGPLNRSVLASPGYLDHGVRGYTAGLGMTIWNGVSDALVDAGAIPGVVDPAQGWHDIPVVKGFTVRFPSMSAQSIADFYDKSEAPLQVEETLQKLRAAGEWDAFDRLDEQRGDDVIPGLRQIRQDIGGFANAANEIWLDDYYTAEEKRQLIDELYIDAIDAARFGLELLRDEEARREGYTPVVPPENRAPAPEMEKPPVSLVPPEPVRTPRFQIKEMGWSFKEGVSGEGLDPGAVEVLQLAKERIRHHSKDAELVVTDAERKRNEQRELNRINGKAEGWVSGHEGDVAVDIRGTEFTQKQREDIAYFVKTRSKTPGIQYVIEYKDKHIHFEWDSI